MQGLIHIYCGDGKGKTSAALGLGLRASGQGLKVVMIQFLKGCNSGELKALENIPYFQVIKGPAKIKFFRQMNISEKQSYAIKIQNMWQEVLSLVSQEACQVLILDEICAATNYGLIELKQVLDLIMGKPYGLEVIMTGRKPAGALLNIADYITEMQLIRHPFAKGIKARQGIEY